MSTLKTKTTSPFTLNNIDPSIGLAWPVAKQHIYVSLVNNFQNTALRMLQDADCDSCNRPSNAALARKDCTSSFELSVLEQHFSYCSG